MWHYVYGMKEVALILNVQSLHLQGIKPTSILCLPSDGTNTETSFCPTVKSTSPHTSVIGSQAVSINLQHMYYC